MRNTVLVVTSDHGESFGEHGTLGHGLQLHDELVHVPMVVKGPAPFDRPRTVDAPIALNDLLPTFLDRVGLPPLPGVDGRSALPVLRGDSRGRAVVSEEWLNYENTGTPSDTVLIAARRPSWKYYAQYDRKTGMVRESAYDLAFDPGETQDLAAQTGTVVGIPFDDLLCPAVEKIRDLLWGTRRDTSTRTSTLTIPYATRTAGPATPRPRPCGIEIR
jgi:arylsulfatase A-like enzyme